MVLVREGNAERGFTLIELMIVVAIIAVLAVIVVPQFTRESRKAKGRSEVNAMFAELATRLEQYRIENNSFPALTSVATSGVTCPATAAAAAPGINFTNTCITTGSAWQLLRVSPPESTMRCAYTVVTGTPAQTLAVPTGFRTSTGTTGNEGAQARSWWYLYAECDTDRQGGTNATYYQSSIDQRIQAQNEAN